MFEFQILVIEEYNEMPVQTLWKRSVNTSSALFFYRPPWREKMSVHIQDLSVCRAVHNQFVVSLHLRKTMNHNEKCLFLQLETALVGTLPGEPYNLFELENVKKGESFY